MLLTFCSELPHCKYFPRGGGEGLSLVEAEGLMSVEGCLFCKRQALHKSGVGKVFNTMKISKLQRNSDMIPARDFRVAISSEKSTNMYLELSIFKLKNILQIKRLWQQEAT